MGFHPTSKMKEFKNIDRLFQEKFRDFEQTPPDYVWENISTSLSGKTKNKKRAVWFWFSGIAAGLALLFLLNNPFTQDATIDHSTTDTDGSTIIKTPSSNTEVTTTEAPKIITNKAYENTNNTKDNNYRNNTTLNKTAIKNNNKKVQLTNSKEEIAIRNNSADKSIIEKYNTVNAPIISLKSANNLASNEVLNSNKYDITNKIEENSSSIIEKEVNTEKQIIAENETKEKTELIIKEKLTNNKNDNDSFITENTEKKWSFSTVIAPVFLNTFDSSSSSFGSSYNNNSKEGQLSTSYGVQVAYQVNDKLSVQTGLHKVDYGYKTNEVYVSLDRFADNNESGIVLTDIINIRDFKAPPSEFGVSSSAISSGSLLQVFGYYEIPLEVKYKLKEGKLGFNVLGGFSTLIRNKDEIYYQIDDFSEKIAATSNLNPVNLTGNIGLEANYKINKNMYFNITPMFKAHTNTFSKDAGKSNPYTLGVYSGLNYRF